MREVAEELVMLASMATVVADDGDKKGAGVALFPSSLYISDLFMELILTKASFH